MATERKVYRRRGIGHENHKLETEAIPKPGFGQVLIRVHALALNYRDLVVSKGADMLAKDKPLIPLSDAAGEVVEIGEGVTEVKKGDRVSPHFSQWQSGDFTDNLFATCLAGGIDGVAAQYVVLDSNRLVKIPDNLSYEEAATLPGAAVTAWNALFEGPNPIRPGETLLVEGTGGVSVFGILFGKAAGARVIVTSSSDEKLEKARKLGASDTINYKKHPEWQKEVLRLTNGVGADHVLEVGGKDTAPKALESIKLGGTVHAIGGVSGFDASFPFMSAVGKAAKIRSIFMIGTKQMFERLVTAIAVNKIKPVVDKVFEFDQLPAALSYLEAGSHFGKVVIRVK